jgi:hypothetical protein
MFIYQNLNPSSSYKFNGLTPNNDNPRDSNINEQVCYDNNFTNIHQHDNTNQSSNRSLSSPYDMFNSCNFQDQMISYDISQFNNNIDCNHQNGYGNNTSNLIQTDDQGAYNSNGCNIKLKHEFDNNPQFTNGYDVSPPDHLNPNYTYQTYNHFPHDIKFKGKVTGSKCEETIMWPPERFGTPDFLKKDLMAATSLFEDTLHYGSFYGDRVALQHGKKINNISPLTYGDHKDNNVYSEISQHLFADDQIPFHEVKIENFDNNWDGFVDNMTLLKPIPRFEFDGYV